MYLIPGTGCTLIWQEWIIVGGWIILGLFFYLFSRFRYRKRFASNIETEDETDG